MKLSNKIKINLLGQLAPTAQTKSEVQRGAVGQWGSPRLENKNRESILHSLSSIKLFIRNIRKNILIFRNPAHFFVLHFYFVAHFVFSCKVPLCSQYLSECMSCSKKIGVRSEPWPILVTNYISSPAL